MKPTLWFLTLVLALEVSTAWAGQSTTQPDAVESEGDVLRKAEQSAVLILVGDGAGRVQSVSAGVVIRSDGIVLTAYTGCGKTLVFCFPVLWRADRWPFWADPQGSARFVWVSGARF
ncbi:MAG: hypothetical protein ABSF14_23655, partial [Terriglobia bacterium]